MQAIRCNWKKLSRNELVPVRTSSTKYDGSYD